MLITFVLPTVNMNGGIRVVAIYAAAFAARGHKVTIISPPPKDLSLTNKLKTFLKGNGWPSRPVLPKSHLDGLGLDHRVLATWRPVVDSDVPDSDVVIATWWETAEWVDALSPNKGAKVYFIQHHEVFNHLPIKRCHETYRLRMHKIVIARWLSEVMRTQYDDHVVDLVPNSVDRTQFHAAVRGKQSIPTVGFLYSAATFKGLDVTLAAIGLVRERIPELRCVCFGSIELSPQLPLPEGTEFFFSPPQDQIRDLYSKCDVWVTASRKEGFNLPALEAMACRTPLVSTRAGWPEEAIINRKNGILVDVEDIKGIATGIDWVLSLSDLEWRRLSLNAFETSMEGSWEESSHRFENALVHACQRALKGEIRGRPTDNREQFLM